MKPVTNRLLPVLQASMEIRTATKVNGWLYFLLKLGIFQILSLLHTLSLNMILLIFCF